MITNAKYESEWMYRQLFVQIKKDRNDTTAYVTNDGWFVDRFYVESENEADFQNECQNYLESERFKASLKKQRGY